MKLAYLYPVTARYNSEITNPYLDNFQESLKEKILFLNLSKPSKLGIIDLTKYYFKVKYIFLHWPENIPDRKYGLFQSIFLLLILWSSSVFSKKIIWTMHNRVSNAPINLFLKKILFKNLVRFSSQIITHASEGKKIASEISTRSAKKVLVIPHPVKEQTPIPDSEKKIDILIWGTVVEYKGVDKFLEYLHSSGNVGKYTILIAGKVLNESYFLKIKGLLGEKITLINEYLEKEKLIELASFSRIILFPYIKKGVLSSGVLMDSLTWKSIILGPDIGAFRDLANENLIFTYSDFDSLLQQVSKILQGTLLINPLKFDDFLKENTWEKYSEKVLTFIGEK